MNEETIDTLLPSVKKRLRITFDQVDDEIREYIESGMGYLQEKAGSLDFSIGSIELSSIKAKNLLKEWCVYCWNGTQAFFGDDYQSEIIALQILVAAERGG